MLTVTQNSVPYRNRVQEDYKLSMFKQSKQTIKKEKLIKDVLNLGGGEKLKFITRFSPWGSNRQPRSVP